MASKPKAQNSSQSNVFKIRTPVLNLKLQVIRLAQGHYRIVHQLTETTIFIVRPMKKLI